MIKNAFGCFDEENQGVIHEDRLRELLTTMGDRYVKLLAYNFTTLGILSGPICRPTMACKKTGRLDDLP